MNLWPDIISVLQALNWLLRSVTSPISIHDLLWFFVAAQVPPDEEEEEEEGGEKDKNEKNEENKEKKKEVKKDLEVIRKKDPS